MLVFTVSHFKFHTRVNAHTYDITTSLYRPYMHAHVCVSSQKCLTYFALTVHLCIVQIWSCKVNQGR